MATTIEKMENNTARLTFNVDAQTFEKGMQFSYNKNKSRINIQGFRKGKAPRKLIEMQYGKEIFYDDAINHVLGEAYEAAATESGLEIVSKPEIDVESIDAETGVVFSAIVTVKPEVKVGNYKGLSYKKFDAEVSEEDILTEINQDRDKNAREISVTDRPIQNDDIAVISYEGSVEGAVFEGGQSDEYELKIGSHSFIDNFEEQLIGHNVGDDIEVNVTFPSEYHAPELAGKPALFKVEILEIKFRELPEINDDFAADVSEFDTLDEYKEDIKARLIKSKEAKAESEKEQQVMRALIAATEINLPQVMVENQIDNSVNGLANNVRAQGIPFETYLQYMGQTVESIRNVYRKQAEEQVRGRLCLEAVADAEDIQISDEELDIEVTRMAEEYGMERERLVEIINGREKDALAVDLKVQKALKVILESSICQE